MTAAVSAVARLAPIRNLVTFTRGNPYFVAAVGIILLVVASAERWEDTEVQNAVDGWRKAASYLGDEQFGAAIEGLIPSEEEWSFDDRDAFDSFVQKLRVEVLSIVNALESNADTLDGLSADYSDALDGLVDALTPILVTVIAVSIIQNIPALAPVVAAVTAAGTGLAIYTITEFFSRSDNIIVAFMNLMVRLPGNVSFENESRPGWASIGTSDPDIQDITIDWILDPSDY